MRARTSALRFVSCVVRGEQRSRPRALPALAFAAWNSSTESPKRSGSPPTSLSASRRAYRYIAVSSTPFAMTAPVVCWKRTTNSGGVAVAVERSASATSSGSARQRARGRAVDALAASRGRRTCGTRGARRAAARGRARSATRRSRRPRVGTSSRTCSVFASWRPAAKSGCGPASARRASSRPSGSTNSASASIEELVAGRPLDRPGRQRLTRFDDLLDPDVPDAGVAQPLAGTRAGSARPSTWSTRTPSTTPSPTSSSSLRVRDREHLGVLDAHAGEVVDVEEAPVATRRGSRSKNCARSTRSRQNGFSSDAAMWLGTMSTTSASPAAASARKRRLAAELVGDARRVDDVVAVGRARARLHDRREVQVADAEVAEVRHERRARRRTSNSGPSCSR